MNVLLLFFFTHTYLFIIFLKKTGLGECGELQFGIGSELSLILKEIKVITDKIDNDDDDDDDDDYMMIMIKVITDKIRDDEESGAAEADWKFAAMVIFLELQFWVFSKIIP